MESYKRLRNWVEMAAQAKQEHDPSFLGLLEFVTIVGTNWNRGILQAKNSAI